MIYSALELHLLPHNSEGPPELLPQTGLGPGQDGGGLQRFPCPDLQSGGLQPGPGLAVAELPAEEAEDLPQPGEVGLLLLLLQLRHPGVEAGTVGRQLLVAIVDLPGQAQTPVGGLVKVEQPQPRQVNRLGYKLNTKLQNNLW